VRSFNQISIAAKSIAAFAMCLSGPAFCDDAPLYLGVLEERPIFTTADEGQHIPQLRLAFTFREGKWQAACVNSGDGFSPKDCLPFPVDKATEWSVLHNGSTDGTVITQGLQDRWSSQLGVLKVTSDNAPNVQVKPWEEDGLSTWAWPKAPPRRPLVALPQTTQFRKAPYRVRLAGTSEEYEVIFPIVRKASPNVPSCGEDSDHEIRSRAGEPTKISDLAIFEVVDFDNGTKLFGANIKVSVHCPYKKWPPTTVWVYGHRGKALRTIDGVEHWIEFGDFAGKGDIAGIFNVGGYNMGGYALLLNEFSTRVDTSWHYH